MTLATWLLLPLLVAAALGCAAFLAPSPPESEPHPFVTDPADLVEGDHIGRHEREDEGDTRRLGDSRLRKIDE